MRTATFVSSSLIKTSLFCHCSKSVPASRTCASVHSHSLGWNNLPRRRPVAPTFLRNHLTATASDNRPVATSTLSNSNAPGDTFSYISESLDISGEQQRKLVALARLVEDTNKQYNLTGIKTYDEILVKHVLDAYTLLSTVNGEHDASSIIDVGSGAGFPGFVLAIIFPHIQVTLLDSVKKKTMFHSLVTSELSLSNCTSVWGRAEDVAHQNQHREHYCMCVARSVARMNSLAELTLPFVKMGGAVVAQKSLDAQLDEINEAKHAIAQVGGELEVVHKDIWESTFDAVPSAQSLLRHATGTNAQHVSNSKGLVVLRKVASSKKKYPRKAGTPTKAPLR